MKVDKSYPFPTYSGLLNSEHYDKIGPALWLFLWFISSTTKEIEKDGVSWGIVLGHKPLKAREMAAVFGVSEKTVRRWLELLETHEYIKAVRAPYGLMISVKHSKIQLQIGQNCTPEHKGTAIFAAGTGHRRPFR